VYLFDGVPGGVGLAPRLHERHAELIAGALSLVEGCTCEEGCPACVGPRGEGDGRGKQHARRLLKLLAAEQITGSRQEAA
jgi:DEAD/DEAH box helicase domain-containing protein